ncbi:MAG: response regulator transcription factor [Bacteroidota bacterium]
MIDKIRLLVVDDSAHVRRAIAEILSPHHRFVIAGEAVDGLEALAHVKALHPTTVLIDIRMPVMDGFETAARIRDRPDAPDIVMMTEHTGEEYPRKAMSVGACAFLWKCDLAHELIPVLHTLYSHPDQQQSA